MTPILICTFLARSVASLAAKGALPTACGQHVTYVGTSTTVPGSNAVQVEQFLGIRFASKPVRYSPPIPTATSSVTYTATQWGSRCYESVPTGFTSLQNSTKANDSAGNVGQSEDCLFLNIYRRNSSTGSKSVLFWIHGGQLQFGNAGQPLYDGSTLAASQDIIVVTANYRTNILGFPNAPHLPLHQRNLGFLDQRLALKWVHRNIAQFGGDPAKITIAGQSSGASSVDRLVNNPPRSPDGNVLFRAAIMESGQASLSPGPSTNESSEPRLWSQVASKVNCTVESGSSQLACMQKVDPAALINALAPSTFEPGLPSSNLLPTASNDDYTQFETPLICGHKYRHPQRAQIPLLIGTNGREGAFDMATSGLFESQPNVSIITKYLEELIGMQKLPNASSRSISDAASTSTSLLFRTVVSFYTKALYQCAS
ncbi:alpha/beta-hydrolase [Myriangium duriaei CBS 260.36]|uniref:Carboxylic ester hydrolase n=1 Tax=Myriangium duriaei CBS 260.36 TaxID=1168546 RepID=A0A9P4JAA1_9PEZI|nr:alpha/beta-hydrolase [Myriangium duriaei CBS 260.36]